MAHGPGLAGRKDLLQWADTIAARSDLPRLIRRLILETGKGVVELGVPAGEGVSASGWDGTVRASEATAHVPDGLSLWEISTNKNVGTKADADYNKRLTTPDDSPTEDCTYMAVQLRPWGKSEEWAKTKAKQKRWRAVRAFGVDEIETWLEIAPITHAWLSEILGLGPHGLQAGESWWETWSKQTDPEVTPQLVLAGRESLSKSLRSVFSSTPGITTLSGPSLEEIQACVVATALQVAVDGDSRPLSRIAFVDDVETWRALQLQKDRPLVLVPISRDVIKEASTNSPHNVIVPVIRGTHADFEVPAIDAAAAREVLAEVESIDDDRADELARLARRSLVALRRRLAIKPELHSPPWADVPVGRPVRALLVANRWVVNGEGDVEIVSKLSGLEPDALQDALDELGVEEDPLIAQLEQQVALVSPYDAWIQLRGELKRADLNRFEQAVKSVLVDTDPSLEFPPEERWRASFEGKTSTYSATLKRGLAESVALLAVNGDEVEGGEGAAIASYLVRVILEEANKDETGYVWSSIAPNLSLLAEAAPDSFVDAVRAGVSGDDPRLVKMFADPKGTSAMFTAGSPHCNLLWALETVAWSPDHFGQVVDLLARLDEIDPGGELSNRPNASLAAIFCAWSPENSATNAARLKAIDGLRERHEATAWPLMLSMLPERHGIHSPTSAPTFREWKPPQEGVLLSEYWELVRGVLTRLIKDAGNSPDRWSELIERASDLPPELWAEVRDGLAKSARQIEGESTDLWKFLRAFIAKHREFAETDWALSPDEVNQLEAIADEIAPKEVAQSQGWIFEEHHPDLGIRKGNDYGEYVGELEAQRVAAAEQIQSEGGLDALLKVAAASPVPGAVGWAVAGAPSGPTYEKDILKLLESVEGVEIVFASAFFGHRFQVDGWEFLEGLLTGGVSSVVSGRLLLTTGDFPRAWEEAERQGPDIERAFWTEFPTTGLGPDFGHVLFVAQKLLDHDRVVDALDILELYLRKDQEDAAKTANLLAECLQRMLSLSAEELGTGRPVSEWALQQAFGFLEDQREAVGLKQLASLEWAYLQALGLEPRVPALHEQLAKDPDFFVQIISAVYRAQSASEDDAEPSEDAQRIAGNGYRLLSTWKDVPGDEGDGKVDTKALYNWVETTQEKLAAADRLRSGELHIGRVLASAPADPDGQWPCKAVRDLLEKFQSERVEEGLETQVFNSRGVTTRAPEAGGDQERELAAKYLGWAKAFRDSWPRAAAVLRHIASTYEHQAKRFDAEAEARRLGLD